MAPRTGAEYGLAACEFRQRFHEAVVAQQFQHGGAFAAGNHQPVETGKLSLKIGSPEP